MAISEQLQKRIQNLTGTNRAVPMPTLDTDSDAVQLIRDIETMGGNVSDAEKSMYMNMTPEQIQEFRERENIDQMLDSLRKGTYQKPKNIFDMDISMQRSPEQIKILEAIEDMQRQLMQANDPDEIKLLNRMIETSQARVNAPLGDLAAEIASVGTGEDIQLIHAKPNEVVLPEEFFEDEEFENIVENKFREFGINPERAIVGSGIASLNAITGLEEFGFFKKVFKGVKKVAKKVAPIALPIAASFIPGLGPVAAMAVKGLAGGVGTAIAGGGDFGDVLKGGALGAGIGALGGFAGTKAGLVDPNFKTIGFEKGTGISGLFDTLKANNPELQSLLTGRRFDPNAVVETPFGTQLGGYIGGGKPDALGRFFDKGSGTGFGFDKEGNFVGDQKTSLLSRLLGRQNQTSGSGGLGGLAQAGLLGAGAFGLGKLAYDEAKKQKGVPLTPLTTMDAAGRYDIEAEIARRMGRPAPDPVEFGLLPIGTLPELSGGKPIQKAAMGGAIMPMAYAEGGGVAMEDFERMNGEIDGPGTETSDDIPAMLSDGEFVMTGRAVRGAGAFDMKDDGGIITLTPSGSESREKGTNLMYNMMGLFENYGAT